MLDNQTLNSIKCEVEENIGRRVVLKADKGRKRIITKEGIIDNAFKDVFTVRINNEFDVERTVSYTYADILTSTVTLTICQ
uniref:Veg family protein n=1 Tax=Ndongobacter massiliensis TaxID=1871025 RepID=UPI0009308A6B|nr:Veg family protein [Ndongobacter massiliensis]